MSKDIKVIIFADGGSRGNPGNSAVGVAVYKYKRKLIELGSYSEFIGVATNNTAEYKSAILGFQMAKKHKAKHVSIYFDSQLIARQLRGEYKVNKPHLRELHKIAKELMGKFKSVEINETPRENNSVADKLVNIELDKLEQKGVK